MPSTSPLSSRKPSTRPFDWGPLRSFDAGEWSIWTSASRCTLTRSLRTMLAPYVALLAATIAYYPAAAWLLAQRQAPTSSFALAIVISVPIIAMVSWVPRLATERRRIQLSLDPVNLVVERTHLDRARLLEVVLLPHRSLAGVRHRVFITYAVGDYANMIPLASERDVANARGIALELAQWLAIPLSAAGSPPPTARLVR